MGKGKKNRNKIPAPPRPAGGQQRRPDHIITPESEGAPRAWNPKNELLRNMGLHEAGGVMRLLGVLVSLVDGGDGILITTDDLKLATHRIVTEGKGQLQVVGQKDGFILRMVTTPEAQAGVVADNAMARQTGRPESTEGPGPIVPPEAAVG